MDRSGRSAPRPDTERQAFADLDRLRAAKPEDAAALIDVYRASIRGLGGSHYDGYRLDGWSHTVNEQTLSALITDPDNNAFLAGEPPAAFGILVRDRVHMLYVHPGAAGRGVGSRLLRALEAAARLDSLAATRVQASLNARRFYDSHGYHETGREVVDVGGAPFERILMEKRL